MNESTTSRDAEANCITVMDAYAALPYGERTITPACLQKLHKILIKTGSSFVSSAEVILNAILSGAWTDEQDAFDRVYQAVFPTGPEGEKGSLSDLIDVLSKHPNLRYHLIDVLVVNALLKDAKGTNNMSALLDLFEGHVESSAHSISDIVEHALCSSSGLYSPDHMHLPLFAKILSRFTIDTDVVFGLIEDIMSNTDVSEDGEPVKLMDGYDEVIRIVMRSSHGEVIKDLGMLDNMCEAYDDYVFAL